MEHWVSEVRKLLSWKEIRYIWNSGNHKKKLFIVVCYAIIIYVGLYVAYCFYSIFTGDFSGIMSLFGLLILIMLGYWSYKLVYLAKNNPLTYKIRRTIGNKQKEKDKQEEDIKYDHKINCPACDGTGKAYIQTVARDIGKNDGLEISNELMTKKYFERFKKTGQIFYLNEWVDREKYESIEYAYIAQESCPFCKGDGVALAWFETETEENIVCKECQGSGTIEIRQKVDVGVDVIKTACEACNGVGKKAVKKDLVHVKTKGGCLACIDDLRFHYSQYYANKGKGLDHKFDVKLTDDNRDFFSKKKLRFKATDSKTKA
jgi:hypothetical protein